MLAYLIFAHGLREAEKRDLKGSFWLEGLKWNVLSPGFLPTPLGT